ncbi:MAG: outer membrane beta-barrel protein, partial [Bacteroidetes bacterium]|nr:outer membrane beta-barrel protein [Bacteroidota bacterium]
MRTGALIIVLFFSFSISYGQTIKGKLTDLVDNTALAGATVRLTGVKDSSVKFSTLSDKKGAFVFESVHADSFMLKVSFVGYDLYKQFVVLKDSTPNLDLGIIYMPKKTKELDAVTVIANTPPAQQKGDTIQYNASQFKVNPDATSEDMLKKLPGVTIDKDGTVTAQGEQVKKVTIDGREFFGDDATAALRNMPAEIIDKIQVFDKLSDQAQFTGFDDGNTQKSINIVTKADMRNGQFGRVYGGYGTDGRYTGGGNMSFFKNNRRVSLVGLANNINQQNFGTQDLLGVTSNSGGGRGGFGGARGGGGGGNYGGRGGFGGGTDNFQVGQQNGISRTNAFGINYSDMWGKKIDVTGSYFFNNSFNTNNQLVRQQTFFTNDSSQVYNESSIANSSNYNHRFSMRMVYTIDSANSLIFTPSLGLQKNKTVNDYTGSYTGINSTGLSNLLSESISNTLATTSGYNFNSNLLFRHSFHKRGRTISFNLSTSSNNKNGNTFIDAESHFYSDAGTTDSLQNQYSDNKTNGHTISGNLAYTEPIGKQSQLQFNYNPSYTKNSANQETFQYDNIANKYSQFDTLLSNKFDNTVKTQNAGISWRIGSRQKQFAIGVNYQYSLLESQRTFPGVTSVNKSFTNLLPNLRWMAKLSPKSSIRLFYRASTNTPSVTQLQDVINNSNILAYSTGNPNLKQQYAHYLSGRYNFTNTQKGQSFFANIFLQTAQNYISNATYSPKHDSTLAPNIVLKAGTQLSKPINLNGYNSIRTFFTYAMPLKFIKTNVNINTGFSYSRLPGQLNTLMLKSNNYTYSGGIVLASNISEYVDFNLSYNSNYSKVRTSSRTDINTDSLISKSNSLNQSLGIQFNLLSKKGWFFQNDL